MNSHKSLLITCAVLSLMYFPVFSQNAFALRNYNNNPDLAKAMEFDLEMNGGDIKKADRSKAEFHYLRYLEEIQDPNESFQRARVYCQLGAMYAVSFNREKDEEMDIDKAREYYKKVLDNEPSRIDRPTIMARMAFIGSEDPKSMMVRIKDRVEFFKWIASFDDNKIRKLLLPLTTNPKDQSAHTTTQMIGIKNAIESLKEVEISNSIGDALAMEVPEEGLLYIMEHLPADAPEIKRVVKVIKSREKTSYISTVPQKITKRIHFPEDRSVGTLLVEGKKTGQAQGTIEIPFGAVVELEIGEGVNDISFLERFAANDIQRINLTRARRILDDADLVYIKGLTELKGLRLGGERFTDAGLAHIRDLRSLTTLGLSFCDITDKGLQFLSDMTSMQSIDLRGTKISDAGLIHLEGMESLRSLNLSNTSITGEGLVYLKNINSLTKLNLSETRIDNKALANLKGMKSLKELTIRGDRNGSLIDDSYMVYLKDLTSLEVLDLSRTSLTGTGLVHLRNLKSLHTLRLGQTQLQDEHLVHLKFLPSLKNLDLERTPISDNAVEHLKYLTSLDEVRIAQTRISKVAAKKLKEELPPFSNVNTSRAMVFWPIPAYLTQKQVAKLATTIANNEFERLYNKRPFTPPQYSKEQENSRWGGGQIKLTSKDGSYAEVWLNKMGRDQKVRVYLNQ